MNGNRGGGLDKLAQRGERGKDPIRRREGAVTRGGGTKQGKIHAVRRDLVLVGLERSDLRKRAKTTT